MSDKKILQLVDDAVTRIEVNGTGVFVKQMPGAIEAELACIVKPTKDGGITIDNFEGSRILAKVIDKFEEYPDLSPYEVLTRIKNGKMFSAIFRAIRKATTLSEEESKNSHSSSDVNPLKEESAATTVQTENGSASVEEKHSESKATDSQS